MSTYEHRARKRFGQNFLHDTNIIQKIINVINPQSNDHFVEIGPGLGALTIQLIKYNTKLDIIEIDRDLIEHLKKEFETETNFTIHEHDALKFDYASISTDNIRVIGNLPYNISTPLLFHLISYAKIIQDMTFMLQKEVVDRICSSPDNKQYGRLSVMLQYQCEVEKLFTVKPGAFNPAPKVDSAIVKLIPRKIIKNNARDFNQFSTIVLDAFSQRRKTLRNTLKKHLTEQEIIDCNIDPSTRAETLTVDEFVRLANRSATK